MEGELIFLGFLMLIGQIILMQMWNANWFKKQNWKAKQKVTDAENRLNLKKLERDLGLKPSKALKEEKSMVETAGSWISLLKDLDPDQIKALADQFLGGGEEYEEDEDEDIIGTILKNVDKDTIKSFIDGLDKKQQGQTRTNNY